MTDVCPAQRRNLAAELGLAEAREHYIAIWLAIYA
jgi:hypothetical protein